MRSKWWNKCAGRPEASVHPRNPGVACRQILAILWCRGHVLPIEMHMDGPNYKALAITYDPSPQMQGKFPVSQGIKHAQSSQEFWWESKAGLEVELQNEILESQPHCRVEPWHPEAAGTSHRSCLYKPWSCLYKHLWSHSLVTLCNWNQTSVPALEPWPAPLSPLCFCFLFFPHRLKWHAEGQPQGLQAAASWAVQDWEEIDANSQHSQVKRNYNWHRQLSAIVEWGDRARAQLPE